MLSSKVYLLLGLLFIFVSCSLSVDQKPRKSESATDAKKSTVDSDNDVARRIEKLVNNDDDDDDDINDQFLGALPFANNRYSPYNTLDGNYRSRARWPSPQSAQSSQFDDFANGNDWSKWDYLNMLSPSSPSPSVLYDSNPTLSSASSCASVVDSQYPIFSDVCGAVPQARYSLPNAFGHRERWQVAQTLSTMLSSSTDASCTRSVRLLLCPVLFPPCPSRHEPPPVLPCQSYCRAVKARCPTPTLDLLPCEILPQSSDLCPTNQAYGSFIPTGAAQPVNQLPPAANAVPTSNYPVPRPYATLQSLLSSQGLQSTQQQQQQQQQQQPAAPSNLYNGVSFGPDSSSPLFADFPTRLYNNDYRQAQKYPQLTRSAMDVRPKVETKYSTGQRPSGISPQVTA